MNKDRKQDREPVYDLIETSEFQADWVLRNPGRNSIESIRFACEIRQLVDSGANINWAPNYTGGLPMVDKDYPIVVGGTMLEQCVSERARRLREAGFTNVSISRRYSESGGRALRTFPSERSRELQIIK